MRLPRTRSASPSGPGGDAQALAAAAGGRLDGDRVADLRGDQAARRGHRLHGLGGPGDDRDAGAGHQLARARLRAHRLDRARRRADEHDPLGLAARREGRVLREEAVAGMDRVGARRHRHGDDASMFR